MVGATLVSAFSIFGASANASIGTTVDETMEADFIVSTAVGQPFSPAIAEEMRHIDGISFVGVSRLTSAQLDGEVFVHGSRRGDHGARDGSRRRRRRADRRAARGHRDRAATGLARRGRCPGGRRGRHPAGGDRPGDVRTERRRGASGVAAGDAEALGGDALDRWLFLELEDGADAGEVRAAAEAVLTDYPVVSVKDKAEFTQEQQASVGQILLLINAMLVLSMLIAVLGIIITLALSVMERTREIGLLRAVGTSRRQLRRAVRLEAVLIASSAPSSGSRSVSRSVRVWCP